jgi:HK97 family phage major capsid protein
MDDTANTGELLAEETAMADSLRVPFGVITFLAYKYSSKPVRISQELMTDSAFNLAIEIGAALGERVGRITETHFTTGDDSGKPQGATVGSGASVTAAGTGAITADELITLQDNLDPAYEEGPAVGWMMKKATRSAIRKLKDGNSQYLWIAGLANGEPDTLLGKPLTVNQSMPAMTTGLVSVLYGDWSRYVIRDISGATFHRLEERYREYDQTGFVLFSRHDGRVLDAGTNPILRLTQA